MAILFPVYSNLFASKSILLFPNYKFQIINTSIQFHAYLNSLIHYIRILHNNSFQIIFTRSRILNLHKTYKSQYYFLSIQRHLHQNLFFSFQIIPFSTPFIVSCQHPRIPQFKSQEKLSIKS